MSKLLSNLFALCLNFGVHFSFRLARYMYMYLLETILGRNLIQFKFADPFRGRYWLG
jgi:hypothetical protein